MRSLLLAFCVAVVVTVAVSYTLFEVYYGKEIATLNKQVTQLQKDMKAVGGLLLGDTQDKILALQERTAILERESAYLPNCKEEYRIQALEKAVRGY